MTRVRRTIAAAIAGLVVLLQGCGSSRTPKATPTKIRVAYAPVVLNLPLYVALDRGWFQEAGVEVEPIAFTTANDMINALVAGQADVVTGVSLVPVINLESEGPGRVRVMTHSRMDQAHPYDGLVVKKDSRIRQLGGLTAQLDAARAICDAVDRMIG